MLLEKEAAGTGAEAEANARAGEGEKGVGEVSARDAAVEGT